MNTNKSEGNKREIRGKLGQHDGTSREIIRTDTTGKHGETLRTPVIILVPMESSYWNQLKTKAIISSTITVVTNELR